MVPVLRCLRWLLLALVRPLAIAAASAIGNQGTATPSNVNVAVRIEITFVQRHGT